MAKNQQYIALLRGINIGGHHKVPMAELRELFEKMEFFEVKTLLNSGNIIFEGKSAPIEIMEEKIATRLETIFGFPIPVLIREAKNIKEMLSAEPFKEVETTKDIRLYVTFLKKASKKALLELPWVSADNAFQIIDFNGTEVISVLDVSKKKTTEAMGILEKTFGKEITTRNWNTILKIGKLLEK